MTLDGQAAHRLTIPLEQVVFTATAGAKVTLQLVATTVAYTQPRMGGKVTFSKIDDVVADHHECVVGRVEGVVAAAASAAISSCGSRRTARRAPAARW